MGFKRDFELKLMIVANAKMLGDFECAADLNYQTSCRCDSFNSTVWRIRKDDFEKIRQISEDAWKELLALSHIQQK